jgi:hypothetical protein
VASFLRPDDHMAPRHRNLGAHIWKGMEPLTLRHRDRAAEVSLSQTGRQAWEEMHRPYVDDLRAVEPEDPGVLEDLVVELISDPPPSVGTTGGERS